MNNTNKLLDPRNETPRITSEKFKINRMKVHDPNKNQFTLIVFQSEYLDIIENMKFPDLILGFITNIEFDIQNLTYKVNKKENHFKNFKYNLKKFTYQ